MSIKENKMRNWLIKARKSKGLSRKNVAEYCSCSYHAIEKYENEIRRPKPEVAKKIANLLGIDWQLFYEDSDNKGVD
jgi:putative transcriptional regulator